MNQLTNYIDFQKTNNELSFNKYHQIKMKLTSIEFKIFLVVFGYKDIDKQLDKFYKINSNYTFLGLAFDLLYDDDFIIEKDKIISKRNYGFLLDNSDLIEKAFKYAVEEIEDNELLFQSKVQNIISFWTLDYNQTKSNIIIKFVKYLKFVGSHNYAYLLG